MTTCYITLYNTCTMQCNTTHHISPLRTICLEVVYRLPFEIGWLSNMIEVVIDCCLFRYSHDYSHDSGLGSVGYDTELTAISANLSRRCMHNIGPLGCGSRYHSSLNSADDTQTSGLLVPWVNGQLRVDGQSSPWSYIYSPCQLVWTVVSMDIVISVVY